MPKRKLPPNEELVRMYRSGMSCGEIAEATGTTPVTVQSMLSRIGEPRRSAAEAAKLRSERGRTNPARYWLGKNQPAEMVERRVKNIRGPNHYLWKGGKSRRPYRKKVQKEKCERCDGRQNLCIHHKDLDHFNDEPDNLAVLCLSCHLSLHKQMYWDAVKAGEEPPRSTGESHWKPDDWKKWRKRNRERYNTSWREWKKKKGGDK